ncbi:hypothetical protein CDAR_528501 [Caerostris darwini]|uniref:Uncharacterized protein n=1 Tax=Caerostris darwini TaxID=1538125 RepID=A0AAV4P913_9ARAC|nr:hypothetical protein CDAR_528501 [Caerostris darwini]
MIVYAGLCQCQCGYISVYSGQWHCLSWLMPMSVRIYQCLWSMTLSKLVKACLCWSMLVSMLINAHVYANIPVSMLVNASVYADQCQCLCDYSNAYAGQ